MVADSMLDVLERLGSDLMTSRRAGADDLKHILSNASNLKDINDKGWHRMFETIFSAALKEKANYLKQTKPTALNASTERLDKIGSLLRQGVEVTISQIRQKTVKAIYEHIQQLSTISVPALFKILGLNYFKSLNQLLANPAHIEHVLPEDWIKLTKFACDSLDSFIQDPTSDSSAPINQTQSFAPSSTARASFETTELMHCIDHLTGAPHAWIIDRETSQMLIDVLLRFLSKYRSENPAHQSAFSALNHILYTISANNLQLMGEVAASILSVIRLHWSTRAIQLKEQMIVTLIYCFPHLRSLLKAPDPESGVRDEVDSLLQVMQKEYTHRLDRDQLQIDHLQFSQKCLAFDPRSHPLGCKSFALRTGNAKYEQAWMVLQLMANYIYVLDHCSALMDPSAMDIDEDSSGHVKRRKLDSHFEDLQRRIRSPVSSTRLSGLYVLPFYLNVWKGTPSELDSLLADLLGFMGDDNAEVNSWILLSIISAVQHRLHADKIRATVYQQCWQVALRCSLSISTSRIACHLLGVLIECGHIKFSDISQSVEDMIQNIEVEGPALVTDSSIYFWKQIMSKRNTTTYASNVQPADKLTQWVTTKWRPLDGFVKSSLSAGSQLLDTRDLIDFLSYCGESNPSDICVYDDQTLQVIGQAALKSHHLSGILSYLLLEEASPPTIKQKASCLAAKFPTFSGSEHSKRQAGNEVQIFNFFDRNVDVVLEKWLSFFPEKGAPAYISSDAIQVVCSMLLISVEFCANTQRIDTKRLEELEKKLVSLTESFVRIYDKFGCNKEHIEILCRALLPFLPNIESTLSNQVPRSILPDLQANIFRLLDNALTKQVLHLDADVDMDGGYDEENDRSHTARKLGSQIYREVTEAARAADTQTFLTIQTLHLVVLRCDNYNSEQVFEEFASYLQQFSSNHLLLSRPTLSDFLTFSNGLARTTATDLVEHLAMSLLRPYEIERCEVAAMIAIDTLSAMISQWVPVFVDVDDHLHDRCDAVYNWLVKAALNFHATSFEVRRAFGRLLQDIMTIDLNYDKKPGNRSLRTNFIQLLQDEDMRVRYAMADYLPSMFKLFPTSDHKTVYADVLKFLDADMGHYEGLAIRVHTLSRLVSVSFFIMKASIFHLYETAGRVPSCTYHASRSMLNIALSLNFDDAKELCRLFQSQIIASWLENKHQLNSFPFLVFGYKTREEFLEEIQIELVAQLLSYDKTEEAEDLALSLDLTYEKLLGRAFYKVYAYLTASGVKNGPSHENKLRKRLGDEDYASLLKNQQILILSTFFDILGDEGTYESFLSRESSLEPTLNRMTKIVDISCSTLKPPDPLEPFYKFKIIFLSLNHSCKTFGLPPDLTQLWDAATFTFVTRKLFESIAPALGPSQSCIVIRKIRLVVCLAGEVATKGYPLQMTIHGLIPFLTDSYCAKDTAGLIQYLFSEGKGHLVKMPSFLVSTALSILTNLKSFISKEGESGTEKSQLEESQAAAETFHGWFAAYLKNYRSTGLNDRQQEAFHAIVTSVVDIKTGKATDKTDHALLRNLLKDEISDDKLLDDSSKKLAFSILGTSFLRSKFPRGYRFSTGEVSKDDKEGISDREAINIAKILLRTCRNYTISQEYVLWAARMLGRSYAASGTIHEEWTQEVSLKDLTCGSIAKTGARDGTMSRLIILQIIQGLLLSSNYKEAGLAESTIRDIIYWGGVNIPVVRATAINEHLTEAMDWKTMLAPPQLPPSIYTPSTLADMPKLSTRPSFDTWIKTFTAWIASTVKKDGTAAKLGKLLEVVEGFAEKALPFMLHLLLLEDMSLEKDFKQKSAISTFFRDCFTDSSEATSKHTLVLLNCILYLRIQMHPTEYKEGDKNKDNKGTACLRDDWIRLDYYSVARAATVCKMYKTGLMFLEIHYSKAKKTIDSDDLMLDIFRNINDPDSFYGVNQAPSLLTVMERFEYEEDGWKSLSFQGAYLDSSYRQDLKKSSNVPDSLVQSQTRGVVHALNAIGLNALSYSTLQNGTDNTEEILDNMLQSAWKLEQWDLPCPPTHRSPTAAIYKALQSVNVCVDAFKIESSIDISMTDMMHDITSVKQSGQALAVNMRTLAILTEMEEILMSTDLTNLKEVSRNLISRNKWMETGSFVDVEKMHAARIATFGSLAKKPHLRSSMSAVEMPHSRYFEARALMDACQISRNHNVLQTSLSYATYLDQLVVPCQKAGIAIRVAAAFQAASVLWDQGEMVTSIRMLQSLIKKTKSDIAFQNQSVPIGEPELLSKVGTWISEARLEKPDVIINQYFLPAVNQLDLKRSISGKVYHEFAVFCDQQLQNPGNIEDLERAQKLKTQKYNEMTEYENMVKANQATKKDNELRNNHRKARVLYEIDNEEYERLRNNREMFLQKSVENYLNCLEVSDDYDNDAIRFCALWLEHSGNQEANLSASTPLPRVPSKKFVPMMNQLSSRLLNKDDQFQKLLLKLIFRICRDHPYHGLYQLMALERQSLNSGSKDTKDPAAVGRQASAKQILKKLLADEASKVVTSNLYFATEHFMTLAHERIEKVNGMSQINFRRQVPKLWKLFSEKIPEHRIPPPTMKIDVRSDCDYTKTPYIRGFEQELVLASGLSMPKIITCTSSTGRRYKQLGGNDDLRQDAIMEQVFEQVSELLQKSRTTRQRNLSIRTYKVIPLSTTSGIIEFVLHTKPLHDYLLPAHIKYHPDEWKTMECRKRIAQAQDKTREVRVKAYRTVCENFSPVMRYFFLHNFMGPDEWFSRRLAYSRSTAAISILGHILGLGDRHGHNILLDERSGEVVHIDLGVAFEQGRVLPVPEVVPFRLTRDIVDGMGITKTEGVFRRCCEFTLTVLREEAYNIMTILDVLRYDPLYSWTISPIRLKKIQVQEDSNKAQNNGIANVKDDHAAGGEADRALTVVMKKLSKTLSVQATVNELIQQASDERNLAVLYAGWAAYV